MTNSHSARSVRDGDQTWDAQATAEAVSQLTERARTWVGQRVDLDAERSADLTLCTYEALSNCVDHAYRDHQQRGLMSLHAHHDAPAEVVRICITDQGRWVDPDEAFTTRGRGLILMQALADDCTVHAGQDGTTVCLHFTRCPAATYSTTREVVEGRQAG